MPDAAEARVVELLVGPGSLDVAPDGAVVGAVDRPAGPATRFRFDAGEVDEVVVDERRRVVQVLAVSHVGAVTVMAARCPGAGSLTDPFADAGLPVREVR